MKKESFSRREFMVSAGKGAIAAAVIGPMLVTRLTASGTSFPVIMEPVVLNLTDPAYTVLTKVGGAKKFPNPLDSKKPIIVTRISEAECSAFSSKCTHWGVKFRFPKITSSPAHVMEQNSTLPGKSSMDPQRRT